MSYQEQAEKINQTFKKRIGEACPKRCAECTELINAILWFGQVAKFRCRSNTAYDNFAKLCFKDVRQINRQKLEGRDFEVLKVTE